MLEVLTSIISHMIKYLVIFFSSFSFLNLKCLIETLQYQPFFSRLAVLFRIGQNGNASYLMGGSLDETKGRQHVAENQCSAVQCM